MQDITISWRFWLFWGLAFLGFPIAGLLANLIGAVTTPVRALLAGAITGATLGLVWWLVLKSRLPLSIWWVVATSIGMAVGLAISTVLLGSETGGNELLWRAAITGLCMGIAQWIVLRQVLPQSIIWIGVMAIAWTVGWFITRSAGIDLSYKWSVFGASGALAFQFLTGLALYFLFRLSQGIK
ncbi:MAG TPA: hypothetical protein VF918_20285 [Anaerolineales bacterium]